MYKIIFIFALLVLPVNTLCLADQAQQVITLKDGSQIKGQLSGIVNGVYTIKTPIIGDITVNAGDVASITNGSSTAAPTAVTAAPVQNQAPTTGNPLDQQIAATQQKLMSNPQSMNIVKEMMTDPEITQMLQDPALVQAVTSHDYQAVQNNAAVQKLINNPKMKALIEQLSAQQQQQTASTQ